MATDLPTWFEPSNFDAFLKPLKGSESLRFLQVGTYTGDASAWLVEHVLTAPTAILVDVDTWLGSDEPEHHKLDFKSIEQHYDQRLAVELKYGKVIKNKMTSDEFFATDNNLYDFIYIDGDHHAEQVYTDAMNAYTRLKRGGILAFDDYLWAIDDNPANAPKQGIDKFLAYADSGCDILAKNHQVWLRKN